MIIKSLIKLTPLLLPNELLAYCLSLLWQKAFSNIVYNTHEIVWYLHNYCVQGMQYRKRYNLFYRYGLPSFHSTKFFLAWLFDLFLFLINLFICILGSHLLALNLVLTLYSEIRPGRLKYAYVMLGIELGLPECKTKHPLHCAITLAPHVLFLNMLT